MNQNKKTFDILSPIDRFKNGYRICKEALIEHESKETGVILFEETVNGMVFEFELKATEKNLAKKNWDERNKGK